MNKQKTRAKMTGLELAEYHERRKGDVSHLGKSSRPMRRRKGEGPTTSFAVRLTPEEIEQLQEAAKKSGRSLSDFVRSAALQAAAGLRSEAGNPHPTIDKTARVHDVMDIEAILDELVASSKNTDEKVRQLLSRFSQLEAAQKTAD